MTVLDPVRETSRLFKHKKNMEWLHNLKREVGSHTFRAVARE